MSLTARNLKDAGAALHEMRINSGLSPQDLSHATGISARTIERIERGRRPQVRTAFLLASHFDFEVSELWPEL